MFSKMGKFIGNIYTSLKEIVENKLWNRNGIFCFVVLRQVWDFFSYIFYSGYSVGGERIVIVGFWGVLQVFVLGYIIFDVLQQDIEKIVMRIKVIGIF